MVLEHRMYLEKRFLHSDFWRCWLPKRIIVTILAFIGMFEVFAMRMNLSVAIVAMVNTTSSLPNNTASFNGECPAKNSKSEDIPDSEFQAERYDWDAVTQNQILGAFSYGSFITVFIGGFLAEKFGGHRVFGFSVIFASVLTLLTPVIVRWSLVPFLLVRALLGLSEGVTVPAVTSIISNWSPIMERSRMTSVIFSGAMTGNVITNCVSGWLCNSHFLGGWPSVFYVFGIIGCIWYFFWFIFVYESPFTHPFITADEFKLYKDYTKTSGKDLKVPWRGIFSSIPFWAVVLAFLGNNFAVFVAALELPTYLNSVLYVDVQSAGLYSALPCLAFCIGTWVSSYIADKLRKSGIVGITNIRKIWSSIAGYFLAISLVALPFCGCHEWFVIIVYSFGMFMNGFRFSGFQVSVVDMSPTYAGIICGFANGICALSGVLAPTMVGAFTADGATIANWGKVFYVSAAISVITTTFFVFFSSSELQPWGTPNCEKVSDEMDNISGERKSSKIYTVETDTANPRYHNP